MTEGHSGQPTEPIRISIDKVLGKMNDALNSPDEDTVLDSTPDALDGFDQVRVKIESGEAPWLEFGEEWFEQRWSLVRSDPKFRFLLAQYNQLCYLSGAVGLGIDATSPSNEVTMDLWQRRIDRAKQLLDSDDPKSLIDEASQDPNSTN